MNVADLVDLILAWGPCPATGCPGGGGDCCVPHENPGCSDINCCNAVCAIDPFCCETAWDSICAGEAQELCGNAACPGSGSCFAAHAGPGCNDVICCKKVCLVDPFCCDVQWDSICVGEANDLCDPLVVFTFTLSGAQEVPPVPSPGTGSATVTFNQATSLLSWNISFSGLLGPVTAAHFHGPANPGQNAGVQVPIADLSSPSVGSATINATQASQLMSGLWYVNYHTSVFPGGEIRGQVVP